MTRVLFAVFVPFSLFLPLSVSFSRVSNGFRTYFMIFCYRINLPSRMYVRIDNSFCVPVHAQAYIQTYAARFNAQKYVCRETEIFIL